MKKSERLIKEAESIYLKDFNTLQEAKTYSRKLTNDLSAEIDNLKEKEKELHMLIAELDLAKSKAFNYWLNVK